MKCTMDRKDGRPCWNRAAEVAYGLAVCEWHVNAARRMFLAADSGQTSMKWERVKESAVADSRKL